MASSQGDQQSAERRPSALESRAAIAKYEAQKERAFTWRIAVVIVGLAAVFLAAYPVSSLFAGQNTVINVSVNVALSATLAITGLSAYAWGRHHKKRADQLEKTNEQLRERLDRKK